MTIISAAEQIGINERYVRLAVRNRWLPAERVKREGKKRFDVKGEDLRIWKDTGALTQPLNPKYAALGPFLLYEPKTRKKEKGNLALIAAPPGTTLSEEEVSRGFGLTPEDIRYQIAAGRLRVWQGGKIHVSDLMNLMKEAGATVRFPRVAKVADASGEWRIGWETDSEIIYDEGFEVFDPLRFGERTDYDSPEVFWP